MLSMGRKKPLLRTENTGLESKIKIVIWCCCFKVRAAAAHSVHVLYNAALWCFRGEASGVLPLAHHKFLSAQQEQQLEYFPEAASAP